MDIVAALTILGLCIVPRRKGEKNDTGTRLFVYICVAVLAGIVFELITWGIPDVDSSLRLYAIVLSSSLMELFAAAALFLFLLYFDYELYESRDHIKRHLVSYMAPMLVFVGLCLFSLVRSFVLNTRYDVVWEIYAYTGYLELFYMLFVAYGFWKYHQRYGHKRFFHPLTIYVPILVGGLFTYYTSFSGLFLGFALGLTFLTFSRIDEYRFLDRQSLFYNKNYLEYIILMAEEGKEERKSAITANAKGDSKALVGILKEELSKDTEVISLGDGKFFFFFNLVNQIELKSLCMYLKGCTYEYDEYHPEDKISAEFTYKIFKVHTDMKEVLRAEGKQA